MIYTGCSFESLHRLHAGILPSWTCSCYYSLWDVRFAPSCGCFQEPVRWLSPVDSESAFDGIEVLPQMLIYHSFYFESLIVYYSVLYSQLFEFAYYSFQGILFLESNWKWSFRCKWFLVQLLFVLSVRIKISCCLKSLSFSKKMKCFVFMICYRKYINFDFSYLFHS